MKAHRQFTRAQRLCKPLEYKNVFTDPVKSSDQYLTVLAKPSENDQGRLGLAIAKKRVKFAVQRNRIKRLTRESFRLHQQTLEGIDCVVLAKSGADNVTNAVLLKSLSKHWQRVIRRCKKS